jgi:cytochrome c5
MIRFSLILLSALVLLISSAFAQTDREQAMIGRLSPIGSVCMAGEPCSGPTAVVASTGARAAEDIYNTNCMACHLTGASNAPLFGNAEQWAPRIAKGKDALYASVFNGIEVGGVLVMPVNGLCLDCSEDELRSVVDYMVSVAE